MNELNSVMIAKLILKITLFYFLNYLSVSGTGDKLKEVCAANDKIFKLFSYIPFWVQQYITTQLKTNLI